MAQVYLNYEAPDQMILEIHLPDGRALSVDIRKEQAAEFTAWQTGQDKRVLLVIGTVFGIAA